ncbi:terminase small subunit [Caulobacter phage Cr30]|uniref:terminase small subunit n=1 Tax=Caulobacter phage Cr30 TaxID=1357714 RepID=UPI0004A9BB16|nr:terminase small subunit [Caulobacter phage Cr30]AGS81082.1 terminase small subunit [Caulobacter phage Cr30]
MIKDSLAEAFGVTPLHEIQQDEPETLPVIQLQDEKPQSSETDFEFAQEQIRKAIEKAAAALDDMVNLAKASEHPRAYEVLGGMLAHITKSSETLLDLHKKKKEIMKVDEKDPNAPTTINNNLVMTTADVLKLLKGNQEVSE